jgi:S1-C subfamily serine protease
MNAATDFSNALTQAVAKASLSTVLVDARRRYPASGIVFETDMVLTADHVVTRDDGILVRTESNQQLEASIAGRDPGSDLAVLRLRQSGVGSAALASSLPNVGQLVVALGRPNDAGIQASWGIVTAVGGPARTGRGGLLDQYIQSETTAYPGFSGGPLIDTEGNVLGLNTSGLTRGSSLTIPTAVALRIGHALAKDGSVKRGYLGIRTQQVALDSTVGSAAGLSQESGLLVVWLEPNGPAAKAGLLVGDILVGIAERTVQDPDDIFVALSAETVGKPIDVKVLRGGQAQTLPVSVGMRQ